MGLIQNSINWIVPQNSILHQCKTQKELFDKIIFIQALKIDRNQLGFDVIDLYRLKEPPYESLMRSQRTFQQQSHKLIEFSSTLRKLSESISHKNLAPVQFIKINEQNNMCMKSVKIDLYATYYGIELRDIIENRKKQDWRFQQGQILYVAKSLISFSAYLQTHQIAFGSYQSKNIFLSDNGYIKMYLFHMLPDNKHVSYFSMLSSKHTGLSLHLPIAPQMFNDLQENNMTPYFDVYKADIFAIGMILVDMMVESSLHRYYRFGKEGMVFDSGKLKKDLDELREKNLYHEKVLELLENILCQRPDQRWSFQQADQYLDELKKEVQFTYRLNFLNELEDQEDSSIVKNKISFKSQQPESQYVLKSIQNNLETKLNPLPLKSLSKHTSYPSSNEYRNTNKPQSSSNDVSIHRSIYTKRRNTGVSIISSSSYQNNNRSFSKKDSKSSKFTTVRNSRIVEQISKLQNAHSQKDELTEFSDKGYISQNYPKNGKNSNLISKAQKHSQTWLTLGSTRITEENSKTFTFLPPKSKPSQNNPKLHLHHHMAKQNIETTGKKQSSTGISTHIKMHKKNITSPKGNNKQNMRISRLQMKEESKQNQPNNTKPQVQSVERHVKTVRPKMKLNHHFRA